MRTLAEIAKVIDLKSLTNDELITLYEQITHDHVGEDWDCVYYFDAALSPYYPLPYDVSDVMDEYNYRFDTFL